MAYPLYVAFVWHMHQPVYRDSVTGEYRLPWVRLHAAKDYLHMAELLARFPKLRQTFNFVPSLVEQLQDYSERGARDYWADLSVKEELSADDKRFILDNFFSVNRDRVIRANAYYDRLLMLREAVAGRAHLLSDDYYRDLAAWFNLAWIDPTLAEADETLRKLTDKGLDFSRDDVAAIIESHYAITRGVLPAYRQLQEAGQIELTTSPYYHPILPLLIDAENARAASPGLPLPTASIRWPEDAREQVRLARALHEQTFGRPPAGLWPPEGAVSAQLLGLLQGNLSFRWIASDEAILAKSLGTWFSRDAYGHLLEPRVLYQPYYAPDGRTALVFRDQVLSDRIGFAYQHVDSREAAEDLVHRLDKIRENLADPEVPYLVPIILDGENCWDSYPSNGNDFLGRLYSLLSESAEIEAVTVSEYLDRFSPRQNLSSLATGSWIGGNLETWIGEDDQNRAWDYLARTRSRLIAWERDYSLADMETLSRAWNEIYIAEGSDWFWWYYSRNRTGHEVVFDVEFRGHLANVYTTIGYPVPVWLTQPILEAGDGEGARPVTGRISPHITRQEEVSADWAWAGCLEPATSSGAMQRGRTILRRVYYGYDVGSLYWRVEASEAIGRYGLAFYVTAPRAEKANHRFRFAAANPEAEPPGIPLIWEISVPPGESVAILNRALGDELWQPVGRTDSVALSSRSIELAVPLEQLGLQIGDEVGFVVALSIEGVLVETLPRMRHVNFTLT